jgi:hypothetical protein
MGNREGGARRTGKFRTLRDVPTASISSMKMMQGIFAFAALNSCRTRFDPTPTNISSNSDPAR